MEENRCIFARCVLPFLLRNGFNSTVVWGKFRITSGMDLNRLPSTDEQKGTPGTSNVQDHHTVHKYYSREYSEAEV